MRQITLRRPGECAKCCAELHAGATAGYERGCGVYCPGCTPTDQEEIRELRQAASDRKAERREGWADARDRRAAAAQGRSDTLMQRDSSGRADWALVTQPGHVPQRERANRAQERAWKEQQAAAEHRAKAAAYRAPVAVAGDAKRRRDERNAAAKEFWTQRGLKKGDLVVGAPYPGNRAVLRLNQKTVTLAGAYGPIKVAWSDLLHPED